MNGHLECAQYLVQQGEKVIVNSIGENYSKVSTLELAIDFLEWSITKGNPDNISKGCQLVLWVLGELSKDGYTNDPAYIFEYVDKWKKYRENLRSLLQELSRNVQKREALRLVTEAIHKFITEREQQANYVKFKQEQEEKKRKEEQERRPKRAYARA